MTNFPRSIDNKKGRTLAPSPPVPETPPETPPEPESPTPPARTED